MLKEAMSLYFALAPIAAGACERPEGGRDRDRGTPRGATPPTPPGIRVTYYGGSIGLSVCRDIESGETK